MSQKRTKKVFLSIRKIINMYLSKKKKEGDLFILGLVVQQKSPQMIYCLTFVENNAKKKNYRGPYVFDFVKPFCTQDPYVISSGKDFSPASFPLILNNL